MAGAYVESWIEEFIKDRGIAAKGTTNKEIYGWLIGYESTDGTVMVISAIACQRYTEQSVIGAIPDPTELQEIVHALPVGIGFVGIYHSHPDEVFHSRTDNETLMTYSRIYPKMLSAVTNGTDTKWYRYEGGTKFIEFEIEKALVIGEQLNFVRVDARLKYNVAINPGKTVLPQITSAARTGFLAAWPMGKVEFYVLNEKLDKKTKDACQVSPEDCVVAMAKAADLKFVEKIPVQKIKDKHSLPFKEGKSLVRIELEMPSPRVDKGSIQIVGTIDLNAIMCIITDSTAASKPFDMIRDALVDDLVIKIGRGCFAFKSGQPSFIIPRSMTIPYLGIPLKIAMSEPVHSKETPDKKFNPNYFPTKSKFADAEIKMFKGMVERAFELGLAGKYSIAQKMLEHLKTIAKEQHQDALVEDCNSYIESVTKLKETDGGDN